MSEFKSAGEQILDHYDTTESMRARFLNTAKVEHLGGKYFLLLEDLVFWSAEQHRYYVTPVGTVTDFASIPWFLQSFVQVLGNNIRSAIMHDFHCRPEGKRANNVTQKIADDLFDEGMAVDQVRWSKARVMGTGVGLFQRLKYLFKRGESYA